MVRMIGTRFVCHNTTKSLEESVQLAKPANLGIMALTRKFNWPYCPQIPSIVIHCSDVNDSRLRRPEEKTLESHGGEFRGAQAAKYAGTNVIGMRTGQGYSKGSLCHKKPQALLDA